jgi:DNA-binding NarL/FixJ family response regulator
MQPPPNAPDDPQPPQPPAPGADEPRLTPQEHRVLTLVVEGLTNRQIAERLSNSDRTIQTHIAALSKKLRVRGRTALAVRAIRAGIVPMPPGRPDTGEQEA